MKAHPEDHAQSAGERTRVPARAVNVELRNGAIFWNGVFKTPQEAARLRDHFIRQADEENDWFSASLRGWAVELDAALHSIAEDELQARVGMDATL